MKKILNLSLATLATLALATMATAASAGQWGGSIRGDVGPTGSQVIFDDCSRASDRDDAWDFTGRLVLYTSCAPCSTYVAGSWQGSSHTVHSRGEEIFANQIAVKNDFSKAKLGMGFNLFKNHCLAFTMEFGANYLDAKLHVSKDIVEAAIGDSHAKTHGAGLYTSIKGEYKFPSGCLGSNWGIYGKAEVADIIGKQSYTYGPFSDVLETSHAERYNNIVEIDLEAALVYAPCCKFWCDSTLNLALGVRTDSFVNLFRHVDGVNLVPLCVNGGNDSLLSLARPTVFLEVGLKM